MKSGWKYGYIEASIKLPKGKGTWPAFWMMPVNFRSWPADGEIDIMEEVGYHPDYVSSSLHATAHVHSNGTQVTHEMYCKGAEGEFHTYAMEWTAQNITTYVDGTMHYRIPVARGLSGCLLYHFHTTILFPLVRAPWEGAVLAPRKEPGQCL